MMTSLGTAKIRTTVHGPPGFNGLPRTCAELVTCNLYYHAEPAAGATERSDGVAVLGIRCGEGAAPLCRAVRKPLLLLLKLRGRTVLVVRCWHVLLMVSKCVCSAVGLRPCAAAYYWACLKDCELPLSDWR